MSENEMLNKKETLEEALGEEIEAVKGTVEEAAENAADKTLEDLEAENEKLRQELELMKEKTVKERIYDHVHVSVRTMDIFIGVMVVLFVVVVVERKYLITHIPFDIAGYPFHQIEQAYLSTAPVVRVRQEDDTYYLTYKSKGLMAREEYNLPLTKESYEHLRSKADGRILTKKRYLIPMEGTEYTIELDIFLGEYEGLKLAEVEFPSEEAALAFVPPEWFGREVTFTGEYQNSRLVLAENLVLKTKE